MRASRNSTWGGTVSGEWWLTPDGEILYADQDIGDKGHEAIALDHLVDKDVLIEGLLEQGAIDESEAEELGYEQVDSSNILALYKVPNTVGRAAAESPEVWTDIKKLGAREAFMKHHGAIMVLGNAFTLWRLTERAIAAIQNFVLEETEGEPDPNMDLTIEWVLPGHKYVSIDWADFQFVKKPSELR